MWRSLSLIVFSHPVSHISKCDPCPKHIRYSVNICQSNECYAFLPWALLSAMLNYSLLPTYTREVYSGLYPSTSYACSALPPILSSLPGSISFSSCSIGLNTSSYTKAFRTAPSLPGRNPLFPVIPPVLWFCHSLGWAVIIKVSSHQTLNCMGGQSLTRGPVHASVSARTQWTWWAGESMALARPGSQEHAWYHCR